MVPLVPVLLLLECAPLAQAKRPDDAMVQELTAIVRAHCPEATIEVTAERFIARFQTMQFTIHSRSRGGEYSEEPYQEEGPNQRGFLLRVELNPGRYTGPAGLLPATSRGPYFDVYYDFPQTADGREWYLITFAYGDRVDPKLKQAILDGLPVTRYPMGPATQPATQPASEGASGN